MPINLSTLSSSALDGSSGYSGYSGRSGIVPTNFVADTINLDQWYLKYNTITTSGSVITHNCAEGHIFYHSNNLNQNFTANFTNLNVETSRVSSVNIIIEQGENPYVANGVQLNGVAQTVLWQGGVEPVGTANADNVMTFVFINNQGSYKVLAQTSFFD